MCHDDDGGGSRAEESGGCIIGRRMMGVEHGELLLSVARRRVVCVYVCMHA